ncbi:MAG: hypothetical protein ACPGLY_22385 [Rubripirellula sp.]
MSSLRWQYQSFGAEQFWIEVDYTIADSVARKTSVNLCRPLMLSAIDDDNFSFDVIEMAKVWPVQHMADLASCAIQDEALAPSEFRSFKSPFFGSMSMRIQFNDAGSASLSRMWGQVELI